MNLSFAKTNSAGQEYKSVKIRYAFNCQEETQMILSWVMYSGSNGSGGSVSSETLEGNLLKWNPVVPGSVSEESWKIACGKK